MIWRERSIGRPGRQTDGTARDVRNEGCFFVTLNDSPDVTNIVCKARQNEIRVVASRRETLQRPADQYVMADQRDKHRMLDVVIERIAVANTFQGELCRRREKFCDPRLRSAKPESGFCVQE